MTAPVYLVRIAEGPTAVEIGKPEAEPGIEILPVEDPVPAREPVPAGVPEREEEQVLP
jgi:hypothetical protein